VLFGLGQRATRDESGSGPVDPHSTFTLEETQMRFSRTALAGALLASAFMAAPVQAQLPVAGTTRGCFGVSCIGLPSATIQGLTFTGGSFNGTTDASGSVAIGGTGNNFGLLSLSSEPDFNYGGTQFSLFFDFTQPAGSLGNPMFTAMLTGNVTVVNNGVLFTFNPNVLSNSFATVTISNPVGVNADNPAQQISGAISVAPEPASMTLLATGLLGIFGAARRRRKNVAA
jgi:hypothetical protein